MIIRHHQLCHSLFNPSFCLSPSLSFWFFTLIFCFPVWNWWCEMRMNSVRTEGERKKDSDVGSGGENRMIRIETNPLLIHSLSSSHNLNRFCLMYQTVVEREDENDYCNEWSVRVPPDVLSNIPLYSLLCFSDTRTPNIRMIIFMMNHVSSHRDSVCIWHQCNRNGLFGRREK